ncbi:hypothetical protein COO59_00100 [Mixta theicola]|uniref:Uncharacterized protein n=1 Tax=Mixta theicola TaxID=1458355 RepID=A0A2K1QE13_9GAMM|nr:hypothetical protein [Mixta theicola]PNS13269.1 hypothetical protein COO59_00100 [Mixta theicola]GLR08989.1 hypothetical protein GCM10007905_17090 [Mixta theicola]
MSVSHSLFDDRDETLDALEESLIAVNLPGRQMLHLTEKERFPVLTSEHSGALRDPLYDSDERVFWR